MVSPYYYKNMMGLKLTDKQMEHIPCARIELTKHVTMKTTQTFGLLGATVIAPVVTLIKAKPQERAIDLKQRAFDYGKTGILVGLVAGPLMTAAFLPKKPYDSIYDRCYRIRHNKKTMTMDRCSLLGVAVGVGACHYIGEQLDKGAVFGYIGGVVMGIVLNRFL